MATIGAYTVLSMEKLPDPAKTSLVDTTKPGVNGATTRSEGLRTQATIIQTRTSVTTSGAVKSTVSNYAALTGSLVSVTDDFGNTLSNVLVRDVQLLSVDRVAVGVPTSYAILTCEWSLQYWL